MKVNPGARNSFGGTMPTVVILGYPMAVELEDERIFSAYYYNLDDGNAFGGTRYIAGSFFRIKG
jgi:hypothetical protein